MIRLSHINVETPMILDSNSPLTLAVENPGEYYTFIMSFRMRLTAKKANFRSGVTMFGYCPRNRATLY